MAMLMEPVLVFIKAFCLRRDNNGLKQLATEKLIVIHLLRLRNVCGVNVRLRW